MLYATCLMLTLLSADEEPIPFNLPKVVVFLQRTGNPEDAADLQREKVKFLKGFHGHQVLVTGRVRLLTADSIVLSWPDSRYPSEEQRLSLETDVQTVRQVRKLIEPSEKAHRQGPVLAFVGKADLLRTTSRPADDYEPPVELARGLKRLRLANGKQIWEDLEAAGEKGRRVLEDAARKGKLVTSESIGTMGIKEARLWVPKKVPPPPSDPEKTAAAKLALAQQQLEEAKTKQAGVARLREIVRDHPDTKAGAEARELLKKY